MFVPNLKISYTLMNKKFLITPFLALSACGILSAQIAIDFTTAEGYAAGSLGDNVDWNTNDPGFVVDPSGSGTVQIQNLQFKTATYTGSGIALDTNNYVASMVFSLDFTGEGVTGNNAQLGALQFGGAGSTFAGVRRLSTGDGLFDFAINNAPNTFETTSSFLTGGGFTAADIGMAHEEGAWTDSVSDTLELSYSVSLNAGIWTLSTSLSNLTASTVVDSFSTTVTQGVSNFADATNTFILASRQLHIAPNVVLEVDSTSVTAVPEPGVYALMFGALTLVGVLYRRRRR